jgi:type IV pilus assembly protein PilQ
VRVVNGGAVELKVRRLPEGVDLVIEGVGAAPQLQQTTRGSTWEGRLLTSGATTLRLGPQRLSLPEAGLQSISIDGGGTQYRLMVTPSPGFPLARPLVSADGRNLILSFNAPAQTSLQTLSPNLTTPGRVSQPTYVPPLQPRAVAPPVGDMAVGTMMLGNSSYVNVSGPPVTMTLNRAPAKDALMALSRLGGYGFVYIDPYQEPLATTRETDRSITKSQEPAKEARPVTVFFFGRVVF